MTQTGMSWTFIGQLVVLALVAAFIVIILAESLRTPGRRRSRGPVGKPGPPGAPGPACQGQCCKKEDPKS